MTKPILIFAGPTLYGTGIDVTADPSLVQWAPPVRRNDIADLLAADRTPRTLAIVDGTFHSYPSVSHHEIRHALQAGWVIFGLASMGAIRACEMVHLGMKPWGDVARRYLADPDFNDDEVTLVHGTEPPYLPLSEPLIHMREFLAAMVAAGCLTLEQENQVLAHLQPRWYGERTLHTLRSALSSMCGPSLDGRLEDGLANFHRWRIKQRDLAAFVQAKPWTCLSPLAPVPPALCMP